MNDSSKVLKVIFIILLIVTAGELFYFFYYQPSISRKESINLSPPVNNNETLPDDRFAINRGQIEYLSALQKKHMAYLRTFYSVGGIGKVKDIKRITDKQITFTIVDENEEESSNIKFPLAEDVPFQIYQSNNDVITKANLEDLSEGDKIKFSWIYDLAKPSGKESVYNNELIIYKNSDEEIY